MIALHDLFLGNAPYERDGAPEPPLLAHFPSMVHDMDRDVLREVAREIGLHGGEAPPWPPLWHAVAAGLGIDDSASRSGYAFADDATDLPLLDPDVRRVRADELASEAASFESVPWYLALVVSRLAPHVTPGHSWPRTGHPIWDDLIAMLAATALLDEPHADVLRAHPFASLLRGIHGQHERSGEATYAIRQRWGQQVQHAAPPEEAAPPAPVVAPAPPIPETVGSPIDVPRSPRPPTATAPAASRRPASPRSAPDDVPRRLQADVSVGTRTLTHAFIAGETHAVSISIGRQARTQAAVAFPTVAFPEDADFIPLTVRFSPSDGTGVQEASIKHFRDESRESTLAEFTLSIRPDDAQCSAIVSVHLGIEVLQAAVLTGAVVATLVAEATATGQLALQVNAHVKDLAGPRGTADASFVTDGVTAVATGPMSHAASIDVASLASLVAPLADRIDEAAGLLLDGAEDELEPLLRDLARHGCRLGAVLLDQLGPELATASHLQIVTITRGAVLPLEFVYDGPTPTARSKLCANWKKAAADGSCTACLDRAGSPNPPVCPSHFWAIRKVIARHAGLGEGAGDFTVRSEPDDATNTLPRIERAVVGASDKVTSRDLRAVVRASKKSFGRARKADNWTRWARLVAKTGPQLLIALPHLASDQSASPPIPSLELGSALLPSGGVVARFIGDQRPGPVVVLLGCNTTFVPGEIDDFAGQFRAAGSSAVIATLGRLIPEHATTAATTIVGALADASTETTTFGEMMREVRRQLISSGVVLGFLLVVNGDADWKIGGPNR